MQQINNDINYINSYFDKIYVLTLSHAVERHKLLETNLNGLNYQLFFGVDKANLKLEELEENNLYSSSKASKQNRYNKPMKMGEIACSIGHLMIYKDMIENKFEKILVLEDDVKINFKDLVLFNKMIAEAKLDWDLIYLDYNKNVNKKWIHHLKQIVYHIQHRLGLLKLSHTQIKNIYAKPFSEHLKLAGYHDFTSAYFINKNAAKILIDLQTPIYLPSDHLLSYAVTNNLIKGFISLPKIFTQQSQTDKSNFGSYVEN